MAADTCTAQQILFKMADDCAETQSAFVRTVTSQTVLVLTGISLGPRETFKYALATTNGGGIRQVTAHQIASEVVTLASGFGVTVAAGDTVKLAWWDPNKRDAAMAAINEAIRQSWGVFGRETKGATSITLASDDALYDLPTDIGALWEVGVLESDGTYNMKPEANLWRMGGNEGAYTIEFLNNGGTFLPAKWAGRTLYAHYLDKEPEVSLESGTTRLPLDYFNLASYLYLLRRGAPQPKADEDARIVLQNYQAKLGQLKADADAARVRLKKGQPKKPQGLRYEWGK